ncbi:MAG: ISAs1 family transposase, partial [Chloroflexi bacterium]|nr:ISAs1 family transposase [Chloroflexota bacterium]MCL4396660.1 ISAs1 family transposase [Chloroflexota bacterium]MCL4486802.1 ISAs1 family transposase [Chloroflexota bacterium]MCL4489971.1 ISAs1 family transposase [Chloroflexota bacterium]MCL4500182.1 ISAs1 family transposase [Chloroflexota bacterium]
YRRDDTLKEDRCTLRLGHAAEAMAVLNNLVLGLLLRRGVKNVPDVRRDYAAHPKLALPLIFQRA